MDSSHSCGFIVKGEENSKQIFLCFKAMGSPDDIEEIKTKIKALEEESCY